MFADDAALTIHGRDIIIAEREAGVVLDRVSTWCQENKLTVNSTKTEYVIYGTKVRKTKAQSIQLQMGAEILREVESYKYLGTTLDSNLNGSLQLARLNQSIALKMTTFRKMRRYISENTAILLYKTTILPIIDYNDIIYGLLTQQQETKLQRVQNRALRTVFQGKTLSVVEMHSLAKIDTLKERRNLHLMTLMQKRADDELYIDHTNRVTRQGTATLLKVPHPMTKMLCKAPIYKGGVMWNNLTPRTRKSQSTLAFKNAYRANLVIQAQNLAL